MTLVQALDATNLKWQTHALRIKMVALNTCSSALELDSMELAEGTLEKMQEAVKTLIHGVGEDPLREGLLETPRVSKLTTSNFNTPLRIDCT